MGHAADANSGQNVPDKYCQQEITFVRLSLAPQQPAASRWIVLELRQAETETSGDVQIIGCIPFCFALLSVFECLFVSPLSVINPDGIASDANGS